MTFDNGREFCGHEKLSESLKLQTFFANPYHSWERGLNEHTNGLIREFYPKSTNFKIVKEEDFQKAVDFINHRPRKSLDYRTPYEVFFASSETVAFHPWIGDVLPVISIFGANASGKSNILKALNYLLNFLVVGDYDHGADLIH